MTHQANSKLSRLNKYLIEDLQLRLSTDNLISWIEAEGESLSKFGYAPAGHIDFSKALLLARKIRQIRESAVIGKACIKPSTGEYYDICVSPSISALRLRLAIAHEIGHTYWFKPGGGGKPLSPLQRTLGGDPAIEFLCNRFAEALLLPQNVLSELYEVENKHSRPALPALHLLFPIGKKFRVDEQVVVRRVYPLLLSSLKAVICLRNESTEKPSRQSWVTSWCVRADRLYEKSAPLGFRMPLSNQRRVPAEMLPEITPGETLNTPLDGRWWDSVKDLPLHFASNRLTRLGPKVSRDGFAYRSEDRIYLGLV